MTLNLHKSRWAAPTMLAGLLCSCSASTGIATEYSVDPAASWVVVPTDDGVKRHNLGGAFSLLGGDCPSARCQATLSELTLASATAQTTSEGEVAPAEPKETFVSFKSDLSFLADVDRGVFSFDAGELTLQTFAQGLGRQLPTRLTNEEEITLFLDSEAGELSGSLSLTSAMGGDDAPIQLVLVARATGMMPQAQAGTQ